MTAGNGLSIAAAASAGQFSTAVSAAQLAWKQAAAGANAQNSPNDLVRAFNQKMSSWWTNQQVNNPASQAESINNTMALANAGHAANAATTQGNALKTASGTIGGAKVDEVTAITDARATYESESATNDKTYLNAIVIAESTYLKVVANKSHEFRTGAITAEERDSAIATAWGTYQTAAKGHRNTYRRDQAADAADYRTAIAEAEKTLVTTVTTAKETLTNTIEDSQATLNQQRMDEWLTASKSLVNLEANSTINKATSLATAINQLAVGGSSASQMSGDGTTLPATTITSFWVALGEKAQMSTDRITTVKNAERTYYGSTAWTEVVNGVTVNHANGTRGTLDARRDFEVNVSQATATLNKATMHAAAERDRSIATAAWNLAQSRNTYETSWAALDLDSSGWSLGDSSLVMMGFGGSSTATTTTTSTTTSTTTVTTTGGGTGSTSNTSTGVSPSVSSGASYFTRLFTETGATQDFPNKPPSSGSQIPGTQTNPQTNPPTNPQPDPPTPAPPTVPVAAGQNDPGDDAPGYEPAAPRSTPLNVWTGPLSTNGEDPGTILVMPPMASPQAPWDVSVTPPGDLNFYNPFENYGLIPPLGSENNLDGRTPFASSSRKPLLPRDAGQVEVIIVDGDQIYAATVDAMDLPSLAFAALPEEEQSSILDQVVQERKIADAERDYDESLREWNALNDQLKEAIKDFNWSRIPQQDMQNFISLAVATGAIVDASSAEVDKFKVAAFEFENSTYTYVLDLPNTTQMAPWMANWARSVNPWTLSNIVRSSEYSTAFAVQSTIEEKLEDGNLGFELFLAIIPGGSTASTIEEEYYAPDGNGRWGRVAFAFGADVIETLTAVGKFKNASEVASVYRAMAVANSGNAVYAGIDAATRFAEGKEGAWGKSFEALVSLVGVKINLEQYKAAAQKLDAAAKKLAAMRSQADLLKTRTMGREQYYQMQHDLRHKMWELTNDDAVFQGARNVNVLVKDLRTGEYFSGARLRTDGPRLLDISGNHPHLKGRIDMLNREIDQRAMHAWARRNNRGWCYDAIGTHEEVDAVSRALKARQLIGLPADPSELLMIVRWRKGKLTGLSAERCGYCNFITDGVWTISDRRSYPVIFIRRRGE